MALRACLDVDGIFRSQQVTYLFTPWCRIFLEKLTRLLLLKKFPDFYGARMFITASTSARQLSLSSASSNQSVHIPLPEDAF
jgi:hypothetical protein